MKNHWLDKKEEKEFIEALETLPEKAEFVDSEFVDLSAAMNTESRYKEYDRPEDIKIVDLFNEEFCEKKYDIRTSTDKEDRQMIKAILLKNIHKTHWVEEVLGDVGYTPHLAPGCDANLTIACGYGFNTNMSDIPSTSVGDVTISGGDLPGWKDGKIVDMDAWKGKCEKCGQYQWPLNDEHTMTQGDPGCACYANSCNLDIFYPDNQFIQNETLQVYNDCNTDITQYLTTYTPVLAGTMTGTIYPTPGNTSYGFVFYVSSDGKFTFDQFVQTDGKVEYASEHTQLSDEDCLKKLADGTFDKFIGWYDQAYVDGTTLNLQTGILELHYHMGHRPEIVVSYEYNREGSI